MNLYFRLILMFIRARFGRPIRVLDKLVTHHRVLLNDLDLFGHMNNGRYFTVSDIPRIEMMVRSGIWRELKKRKLFPVSAAQTMQFIRPLMPWNRYEIHTRTIGWDDRFIYVEHRFVKSSKLYAHAVFKTAVTGLNKERISPIEVLAMVGITDMPEINTNNFIDEWNQSLETQRKMTP